MQHQLELGYLGVEVADRAAFDTFLADVAGLAPGEPTPSGDHTWRNDGHAQRIIVAEGPADDAVFLGFEAVDDAAFAATVERLTAAGHEVTVATDAELADRRAARMVRVEAPWGVQVEVAAGLATSPTPAETPHVPGGFLTEGVGFGHVVFATMAFDESHAFLTDGLGMTQSDWLEMEIAAGIELEVRFYHCNGRHHSVALARAPFELPQKLHHLMLETKERDAVGYAFDRAWATDLAIANGLGRHDNDRMFSFYVVTPAGFQMEIGHGAVVVDDGWDQNRRYDRISIWGHQPLART